MGKQLKRSLLYFIVILAGLSQLGGVIRSQEATERNEAERIASHDAKSEAFVDEMALDSMKLRDGVIPEDLQDNERQLQGELTGEIPLGRQTFENSIITQELRGIDNIMKEELTEGIPVARRQSQDNQGDLGSLLADDQGLGELFAREDVDSGLIAATSMDSVANEPHLVNTTLLDKMKAILKSEDVFFDVSLLDSFDWFSEEDVVPLSKSRRRRESEPYLYRRFQQPLRAYVPEDTPIGTPVLEIPRNYDGLLTIVHPENPIFRVNSQTSFLETTELLDYEKQQMYTLILRDAENADEDSPFYSHDVIVYVLDINDNVPVFNMKSYTSQVNSRSRVGSHVAQLNASDADGGPRGNLGFLIDDKHSPFTVNPDSWELQTNGQTLDQSQTQYPVYVRTFDQGYPQQKSDPVLIGVSKVNNAPKFSESAYTITFSEKVPPGVVIGRVMAHSLSNIPIGYEIVPTSDVYAINARGELSLKQSVSYENSGSSVITVEAKELTNEQPLSSRVSVTLIVTKANENPTMFTEAVYHAEIDENINPGALVTTVSVTDCDCAANCQCTGNQIGFALVGAAGYFSVNKAGEIRTAKNFDYVVQNMFEFVVTAQDHLGNDEGQVPARAYVQVKLRDINNNAPKFSENSYSFVIDEDSKIGYFVGVVQATDDDVIDSLLTYSIKSDDSKDGAFAIVDQRFGIITLASSLKYDTQSQFTLIVEASDGVLKSEATVEVIVADVNDNAPQFTTCPNSVNVEENLSVGARVTMLKAEDKDRGLNGQVEYFIESSYDLYSADHVALFKVDNITGEVETADVLDREKKQSHFLIVSAKDHSVDNFRQVGYCQFLINVQDENDNLPVFEVARYQTSVDENAGVGTTVLVVKATDADVGVNAEVTYSIDGGNALFEVNSDGVITVKSSLVGKTGMKTLKITAVNTQPYKGEGSSGDEQKTTVEIFVTDQNLPRFTQKAYKTEVKENTLVGTPVLNITAIPTSSHAGLLYYRADLRSSDSPGYAQFPFDIDKSTGVIQISSHLNFERRQSFWFSVNAHEIGSLDMIEASVEITILDVNDVAPVFGRADYDATVSEDAQIGTTVIRLRAVDMDPKNVQISYEIQPSPDSHLFRLKIHSTAIEIVTTATFDREDREYYKIILVAKDNGDPQLSSDSFVTVHVLDENDSPPIFDSAHYQVSVREDAKVGQVVQTVVTRDKDQGSNAWSYFFIAAGNDGRFQMTSEQLNDRSQGNLVIAKPLDYEVRSEYNLTVVASDMKFSAVTTITVEILNANDDPPYFQKSLYEASVSENTLPATLVLTVQATDHDTPANRLSYSLDDAASPYFVIGAHTGFITTTQTALDREKMPVVIFSVIVTDGANQARAFVKVTVLEVNEAPYFPDTPYIGFIEENQPQGTPVRYVVAFDYDDPKVNNSANSKIMYSIDTNSGQSAIDHDGGQFTINADTGLVSSGIVFNLENIRRNFTIHVRATDEGSPRLSSFVPVTVVVVDISEFPPKFTSRVYNEDVYENAVLGQLVLKLTVTDEDFTTVGHRYSITSGNYPFAFYMRPETGEIVVAGILDYEAKKEYNLTVAVSERSISKTFKTDHAIVLIRILDSNDQPPIFMPKTYYRRIKEDVALGTEVRAVTCSDADDGANAIPTFSITAGNIDDSFEVMTDPNDKNVGLVKVSGQLDREKTSSYTLEITATDIGGLKDTATLVVELEDVNDSPPNFTPAYYEGTISEGVIKEQPVATLTATDSDQTPNGALLTFTLKNFQDKFQLKNANGGTVELSTKSIEFKRKTSPLYEVIVGAIDSGSPTQSADAIVFVNVEDGESNEEPFDGTMVIVVYALNGRFPGGTIGYVYYKDNDYQVDDSEYTVIAQEPGSHFTVEASTGRITCSANIPDGEYKLNVTVREKSRDTGPNIGKTVSSGISVRVTSVNESVVQHAVALRFPLRTPGLFVDSLYMKLVKTLSEIFTVPADGVCIFSIGKSSEGVAGSPYGVDVWIVIANTNGGYLSPTYVFAQMEMNYGKLAGLGTSKVEIGLDKCARELKSVGVCKNIITVKNSFTVVSGYYGQIPAPGSSLTVVAIDTDLQDTYVVLPEPGPDCSSSPCRNGGTCHNVIPQGYVCECPTDFRGPECQSTTRTFKRPDSYIWLDPLAAYQLSSVSFEFMSEENVGNGLLLYQGTVQESTNGIHDFLAVSLINGFLTVAISLGGRPASFGLQQGDRLDDGKWHHVELKQFRKEIRLIVDHCQSAITTQEDGRYFEDRTSCEVIDHSFENFIYLNGLGPLQVGGCSLTSFPVSTIATQSFYGCIRNIEDNGKMYDLRYPVKEFNAPIGCEQGCYSHPCKNGGYCEGEDVSTLSCCICPPGYTGCDCSQRSPSLWYLDNSFSEYNTSDLNMTNEYSSSDRQRRHLYSVFPGSSPKYHTDILIRFRTTLDTIDALIFYFSSPTSHSFSQLGIKDKKLYYTFKFADEMKTVTLSGANIVDDKWHTVQVKQRGNTASLQLDHKAKAYGTTGGVIRLVEFSRGLLYIGGMPHFIGHQHKNNKTLGEWSGDRHITHVSHDFKGCTAGAVYNGKEVDKGFAYNRFHVRKGCPCTENVIECANNGTCVDEETPYCLCPEGFTGGKCDQAVVIEPSTEFQRITFGPGMRASGRHRLLDPVWICVFLMCIAILIFLLCLLHALPVMTSERPLIEEEAHDSIMAYQEQGVEEVDATGYDIKLLMKHSRQQVVNGEITSSTTTDVQGSLGTFEFGGDLSGDRGMQGGNGAFGVGGELSGDGAVQGSGGVDGVGGRKSQDLLVQAGVRSFGIGGNQSKDLAVQTGSRSFGVGERKSRDLGVQAGSVKVKAGQNRDSGVQVGQGYAVVRGDQSRDIMGSRGRLESWILERVAEADKNFNGFPEDEMNEIRDEGKYSDIDDLSELEMEYEGYDNNVGVDVFAVDWDSFIN